MSKAEIDFATHSAVIHLQNYLKIRSVHPNVNYDECINFLKAQAADIGLPTQTHVVAANKPVLVVTWEGLQPEMPTIMLNSHMDVVPAVEKNWKHPPFAAEIEDGVIYGRGVQDMKAASIQHLEAIRNLKEKGSRLKRTVHLTFVPGPLAMKNYYPVELGSTCTISILKANLLTEKDDIPGFSAVFYNVCQNEVYKPPDILRGA